MKRLRKTRKHLLKFSKEIFSILVLFAIFLVTLGIIANVLNSNFNQGIPTWTAAIVATATLSLLSFQYANTLQKPPLIEKPSFTQNEYKNIRLTIKAGKEFFASTVTFIFGTIFFATGKFAIEEQITKIPAIYLTLSTSFLLLAIVFAVIAAACFRRALMKLGEVFEIFESEVKK